MTAAIRLQRYLKINIALLILFPAVFLDQTLNKLDARIIKKISTLHFIQESFPLSFKDIKTETVNDLLVNKIYGYVMLGWQTNDGAMNRAEK